MATNKPAKNQQNSNRKCTVFLNEQGELKVRTLDVPKVVSTEIEKNFHQTEANKCKGKTEINEHNRESSEHNVTYMIPQECEKEETSRNSENT